MVAIRPATDADGARLADLRRQADRAHAALMPDFFRSPSRERVAPQPEVRGPHSIVLVALDGAAGVVGYVAARIVDTPDGGAGLTPCRRAHVDIVVVDEAHRRRGIGTALMRATADWARGRAAVEVVLTVWSDNRAAEAMYRGLDFQTIARVLRRTL